MNIKFLFVFAQNFKQMFPHASTNCLDLLTNLLQFHPDKRITATEAMQQPYFDNIKAQGYVSAQPNTTQKSSSADSNSTGGGVSVKGTGSPNASSPSSGSTDNGRSSSFDHTHTADGTGPLDAAKEKRNESPANIRKNVRN